MRRNSKETILGVVLPMIVDDTIVAIGLGIAGAILAIGVTISALKGEFGPKQNYCQNCCNPDHWMEEDRAKLSSEQYKVMKDNIERFKKNA